MTVTPFPLGAYFGNPNGNDPASEAQWENSYNTFVQTMGGARPAFYDNYVDGSIDPSQWAGNASWSAWSFAKTGDAFVGPGSGTTPVIGVPMAPSSADWTQNDTFFKGIISGQYDAVYKGIVDAWANQGYKTVQFRPGYEFNGNFMPWGIGNSWGNAQGGPNAPADFVSAFQHIADLIHQEGAADGINAQVVWNPSTGSWSIPNGQSTADFYPGNQYVDIISADTYNGLAPFDYTDWSTGGNTQLDAATWAANAADRAHFWSYPDANYWAPTGTGYGWSLLDTIALAKANGKPVSLSETGAGSNGLGPSDDPAFVQWEAGVLQNAQNAGVSISNVMVWDAYEFTFTDGSKPNEAAAWGKYFGAQQPISTPTPSPAPDYDTLTLNLSEDAWAGDAQFIATIDGQPLGDGTPQPVVASHSAGNTEAFSFTGHWGPGPHNVEVSFINDTWGGTPSTDRNLYVDSVAYDGAAYQQEQALYWNGTVGITVGS